MKLVHCTELGSLYLGDSMSALSFSEIRKYAGKVDLIITSPPFPLNNKKKYGNEIGDEYKEWFKKLTPIFNTLLSDKGSLVIEIGNAWEPHRPVQSTLHLECLFELTKQEGSEPAIPDESLSLTAATGTEEV